ncbi:MAG TPA: hypothetical protein VE523_10320 [Solirubrobacterales bacterium]|jgi:hypothetical protein|nr:hypothetical protein [Solirubrobacterales bacterium]
MNPGPGWYSYVVAYPIDNALYQWEEGERRLRELSRDPRAARRLSRAVEAVRDELRRRIGPTFTAEELASLYGEGTDWALDAVRWTMPEEAAELDPQAVVDGAFFLYLRGARDYSGGRLIPQD